MLKETQRILRIDGVYMAISYGKPESRSFHFRQPFLSFELNEYILYDESCETEEEKEERAHYIYVCRKLPDAETICQANYEECLE